MINTVNNEQPAVYGPIPSPVPSQSQWERDQDTIALALNIIHKRLGSTEKLTISGPNDVKNYLVLQLTEQEREVFAVMFMDNRHRLIKYEELFYGTIDGASVYPHEVVKAALKHNAAAIVIAHNHPSGIPKPSKADIAITKRLKDACKLVDIRLLDHVIVGGIETHSLAEKGEL